MKKLKLLLSISIMCLSIAVLCFGVFSALSVSYTISGTISYTVNDAFVKVSTVVYKGENRYTTNSELETLANALAGGTQNLSDNKFTADTEYTIAEYDSSDGQNFSLENVKLTLSSTNPSYLVEMTITNLSPSVNVWAKANWNLTTGSNIVQGNNASQPTISSTATAKVYFVVSIEDMTQSISSATYTMGLNIGINDMPTTATVAGDVINSTYGTTWETFSSGSTVYTFNSSGYLMKNNELMYYNNAKVSKKDEIIDGATYSERELKSFIVELKDSGSYWYVELGTYNSSKIRWILVSLDGETKYEYTSTKPTGHYGAIFLQQSVSGGTVAFDASNSNNYYDSDIRTNINTLSNWNLTESDVSSLISKRNITGIEACYVDGTYKYTGTTDDYFWLLSDDEVKTFLGTTNTDRIWIPEGKSSGVNFWLRSPHSRSTNIVYCVDSVGIFDNYYANYSGDLRVRAAFKLA